MTDLLSDVDTPSDAELISRVRGGDVAAYGDLFSRHQAAAHRLARQLVRGSDSDDLVSEAFAKVLAVLQGGGGPDVAFRAYLLTAVRRLHVDRVRAGQRLHTTDDLTPFDPGVPFQDTAVAGFENGAAAKAFASLPERWQLVLWHLEVEGQKPADIAPLLGMSANSVSALAYRAREGLRQAFLTMHISDLTETDCRWVNEHLGAFIRSGLSKRDHGKVQQHLDGCRRCTAMYLELTEVNSNLAGIIGPLLLGAAATGYLASSGAGAAGLLGLLSRAKDLVLANTGAATAAGVAVGVTAAAAVAAVVITSGGGGSPDKVVADPSRGTVTTAPASPGTSPGRPATTEASPSPSGTATTAPTALPSTVAPNATLSALPVLPTDLPSDLPSDQPSDAAPSDTVEPAALPDRFIGDPVVDPAGFVTVQTRNLRADDVVDVSLFSDETTLSDPATDPSCRIVTGRHAVCTPGAADLRGGGQAVPTVAIGDYTIRLALDFPGYMVSDDVSVLVSVDGQAGSTSAVRSFRPGRPASYDFAALRVTGPAAHTVTGDVDHFRFGTVASLPPRVTGLRYELTGPGRFRPADAEGCTATEDRSVLRCPGVRRGDTVSLPVDAEGLTGVTATTVAVSSLDGVVDTTPDDRTDSLTLRPGADLGLDLAVLSANPGRDGLVELDGRLTGVRAGLGPVTYRVTSGATFAGTGNDGCTVEGATMTCPPADGALTMSLLAADATRPTPVTVSVVPAAPFEAVGDGAHAADLTLPGRPTQDYAFTAPTVTAHSVSGDTDRYTFTGVVGPLPSGSNAADFAVADGGSFAAAQPDGRCRTTGSTVHCTSLVEGERLALLVESTVTSAHPLSVTLLPTDPFDDPDTSNNTTPPVTVRPGTALALTPSDLGTLHATQGDYEVRLHLSGVRSGLPGVTYRLGDGTTVTGSSTPGCSPTAAGGLTCPAPVPSDVTFTVRSATPARTTPLTVSVAPGADFEQLGTAGTATGSLVAVHDFSMGALSQVRHTVTGDTDRYTLRSQVADVPDAVDRLTFRLTGAGSFAAGQDAGCAVQDARTVSCGDLGSGRAVDLAVDADGATAHAVEITLVVPDGYDDPDTSNNGRSLQVAPGVDLSLTPLRPDNASPANDDDQHLVSTTLGGVRRGLSQVTYTLSGAAAFVGADVAGCTASGTTLTCTAPADGPVTFTVRATDARRATDISIGVAAPAPFEELAPGDNADAVTLAARPTYDFALSPLEETGHTVSGDTDAYTLRSTVAALPAGLGEVAFTVTGGTFAAAQDAGCTRTGTTSVTCGDLASARAIGFRVESPSTSAHDVTVALQVPRRYDDPDTSNDSRTLRVTPGVDLATSAPTPADPTPRPDRATYQVATAMSGIRPGLASVRYTVSGATLTAVSGTGCSLSGTTVTCATPTDGRVVTFTLKPANALAATAVTVALAPVAPFVEVAPADNSVTATLAPDVVLDAVTVRSDPNQTASVRVAVSGVPPGVSTVRLGLGGGAAGLGAGKVHFTDGASGADGEGSVDCYTSDASGNAATNGLYATCTGVGNAASGAFYVDTRLAHPHGTDSPVVVSVLPGGVDEGTHGANNSRALTIR